MKTRRSHYSTSLAQSQGIIQECLTLFELWEEGQTANMLLESARQLGSLQTDSERRLRNIVTEGFGSRFLRPPHLEAAPEVRRVLLHSQSPKLIREIILLYALRQHGIFFDFMTELYWTTIRSAGNQILSEDVDSLIDKGVIEGKLARKWSPSVVERVVSYVLGMGRDFELLSPSRRGRADIHSWHPHENTLLYLAYDLHFLGLSDDQVINAEEWTAFGLSRPDVILYLQRFESESHLVLQDSGSLCRIEWSHHTRNALTHVLI
ncbi:DUF1819 family protein [Roseibacillus ishigakijimensis]|uniref:DUF1819 family protein n=2 Tax=Roseibacillus ishigakijimensis TaxID=454146 RepID=A0A934RSQ7_9BACT|nr:BrxA family protein [Roseibacillus ishigakijimensis]MBK1834748.1 DUF1819 family protein [Roseibacillus ishigakijimensis]